jgi:hypothetical protein
VFKISLGSLEKWHEMKEEERKKEKKKHHEKWFKVFKLT